MVAEPGLHCCKAAIATCTEDSICPLRIAIKKEFVAVSMIGNKGLFCYLPQEIYVRMVPMRHFYQISTSVS